MAIVTVGCDPELFLQDETGKLISSIGKFGGTKEAPRPMRKLGPGFALQEDNVALEFNVPPAKNGKEFAANIQTAVDELSKRAARRGLSLAKICSHSFSPDQLDNPKARAFGCDPDYNAYTGDTNPRPQCDDPTLRSAGGHIAFGLQGDSYNLQTYVKAFDALFALPLLLCDPDTKRRALYGKAGAYRKTPFGVEYRTLSNFWVFRPELVQQMLDFVVGKNANELINYIWFNSFDYANHFGHSQVWGVHTWEALEWGINNNRQDMAIHFLQTHPALLKIYRPYFMEGIKV